MDEAIDAFRAGNFVLLHDSAKRENEVDMAILAYSVKPEHVAAMRMDAGGLICVALHPTIAKNFGLPYLTEIYREASRNFNILNVTHPYDLPYDEHSAFSIAVNHRHTFTGITDIDRALTISEIGKMGARGMNGPMADEFGREFRSPGHVPLLRAAEGLLAKRKGHTELVVALAELLGVTPVVAICEMLDAKTNRALSRDDAIEYGREHGFELLDGSEVIKVYGERMKR